MVIHLIPFFSIYFFYPQLSLSSTSLLFYPLQKTNFQFSIALGKTICQPNLLFKALGDTGLIPGSGRSPKGGNGNSLQHPCLENSMDTRAWSATVHGITEFDTSNWARRRRQWHPTPVLLPGKSHGRRSLVGGQRSLLHEVTKSRTRLSDFTLTFHFHALKKEMATHSSILAWRIPGTGQPAGLPSMGSRRVGHDWSDLAAAAAACL